MKIGGTSGITRGCLAALLALLATTASGATPPSIETFAAYSDFGAVTLSPDGNRIAYTARANGKRALIVLDLEKRTMKPILAAEEDSLQINWCRFKTPQRLLCGLRGVERSTRQPFPISRLIAINADGTGLKVLVQNGRNGSSQYQDSVLDWQDDDPSHVLILADPAGGLHSVSRCLLARRRTVAARNWFNCSAGRSRSWYTDDKGVVRYGEGCDDGSRCQYVTRDTADAPWRVLNRWERFENAPDFDGTRLRPSRRQTAGARSARRSESGLQARSRGQGGQGS